MNFCIRAATISSRAPAFFKLVAVLAFSAATLLGPQPVRANRLGADIIALFPKEVGEFAYADLKKARTMPWFPQLQEQMLPERFRQFEKFLATAGVDPNTQVEELAWGLVAEVATSKTDAQSKTGAAESTASYFKRQKLPTFKARNYTLYAFGTGSGPSDLFFLFIDSSTAAFGHRSVLEKMVEVRFGAEEGLLHNDKFFPLINEANGNGIVWAVLNPAYTRLAMQQLAPEVDQFPEAAKLVGRMQNMLININASSGIDRKFQSICASPDDANTMAQLLQAGLLYKRYQSKDNPDMADMLDKARVAPSGDRVILNLALTNEQMASLIKHNTFALKM